MVNYIFDVDGTLTRSRERISNEFRDFFLEWMSGKQVFLVTGSDKSKTIEQVGEDIWLLVERVYQNAGNAVFAGGRMIKRNNFDLDDHPDLRKELLSLYVSSAWEPKYGKHIEERVGMINFSTIGRACTREDRERYFEWDKEHKEREKICAKIVNKFTNIEAHIGGQISIDIHPQGLNKSQIMSDFDEPCVFFGDRCEPGGNDNAVVEWMELENKRIGAQYHRWFHVRDPGHTRNILEQL